MKNTLRRTPATRPVLTPDPEQEADLREQYTTHVTSKIKTIGELVVVIEEAADILSRIGFDHPGTALARAIAPVTSRLRRAARNALNHEQPQ